jgi:hypothetical protein
VCARADFLAFVERRDEIWRALATQGLVRSRLPFQTPADLVQGRENLLALDDGHVLMRPLGQYGWR